MMCLFCLPPIRPLGRLSRKTSVCRAGARRGSPEIPRQPSVARLSGGRVGRSSLVWGGLTRPGGEGVGMQAPGRAGEKAPPGSHPERYNPDTWTDEYTHLSKPGQREIQSDLLYDYRTNVASYPTWQTWLRAYKPPTLVVWGRNDPSFIAPGGEAFRRDLPDAEIHLLDAAISPWTKRMMKLRASFSNF